MIESPHVPSDAAPMSRRRKLIVPLSIVGMIVLLAAGVFALKFQHLTSLNPGDTSVMLTPPANWQTYRDPNGYFTMRMPPDWQERVEGQGTFGNTKTDVAFDQTMYRFGPDLAINHHISLSVTVAPVQTAKQRQFLCQQPPITTQTKRQVGNLSAYYSDDTRQLWLYTQNSYLALQYYYPGLSVIHTDPVYITSSPTPTPVPAAQVRASQAIIDAILASFTPIPDAPLAC